MDPAIFPASMRGFMIAAFAAAYMSTIGTQLNWGASYVINDFYRRFLVRDSSERHYVIASQVVTVLLMIISLVVTQFMGTIQGAWQLLMVTGAGTGTVLLLRWFWWRMNAWSEVSAMISASIVSVILQVVLKWDSADPKQFAYLMIVTVSITTAAWLAVTLMTQAEPRSKLIEFYRKVRPEGGGWNHIAAEAGLKPQPGLRDHLINWVLGCALIYCSLFGIGKLIFKEWLLGSLLVAASLILGMLISRNLSRQVWESPEDELGAEAELSAPVKG
jgi:hypothetical protein